MKAEYAIEIESLDLEGRGVGHREGKVVFVEGALPGEQVLVAPIKVKPSYETARAVEVRRESTLRVRPRCPHFGIGPGFCGGCAMQHVEPRAQVAIKQRVLEDALWHVGRVRPQSMLRAIHGPSWSYRYRARLAVRYVARKGGVLVGFHERASSYVADMRECHVLPPQVARLLVPLRELVGSLSAPDRLPQIEVAVAESAGVLRTVLVFRHLLPLTPEDCNRLSAFGRSHGIEPWLQPGGPQTAAPLDASGQAPLRIELAEFGVGVAFTPTDFTQVNHAINEVLVRGAVRLLAPRAGDTVADFFCGLGNFTLPLATQARQVVGFEGHAGLVERARQAATDAGLGARTRFETRNLFEWTADDWDRLVEGTGGVDLALLDPPREGALAVARVLAHTARRPRRVVYVSCNPATLARDCAMLVHEGGWQLKAAGVVNMFPHTAHVESVAMLEPAPAAA